jgi:hypothetical protein
MRPEGRGITGVWQADNVSDQVLHTRECDDEVGNRRMRRS